MHPFALLLSLVLAVGALFASDLAKAEGALAIGDCGAYGYSVNNDTISRARERALDQCRSHGGKNCKVEMTMSGNCVAFAIDRNRRCGAAGWARRNTRSEAEKVAVEQCHKYGGSNCRIRTRICDKPKSASSSSPAPALTTNWTSTTLDQQSCLDRAEKVMKDAGLTSNFEKAGQSVFGEEGDYTAQIRCVAEKDVAVFVVVGPRLKRAREHMKAMFGSF